MPCSICRLNGHNSRTCNGPKYNIVENNEVEVRKNEVESNEVESFLWSYFLIFYFFGKKNKNIRNVSRAVSCELRLQYEIEIPYLFIISTGSIMCAYVIIGFKHLATKK